LDVSENSGTPKSSILIGFSIINHPFWDIPIYYFWKHPFFSHLNLGCWVFWVVFTEYFPQQKAEARYI